MIVSEPPLGYRNLIPFFGGYCILNEGGVTRTDGENVSINYQWPIDINDWVVIDNSPDNTFERTKARTVVKSFDGAMYHSIIGLVGSHPTLVRMPKESILEWKDVLEGNYCRMAVVQFYIVGGNV